jgi:hypothetical protein
VSDDRLKWSPERATVAVRIGRIIPTTRRLGKR